MKKYIDVPENTRSVGNKKDCVFLWLYARNCNPYRNYDDIPYDFEPVMPMVLAQVRWDGLFGTTGGHVEQHEDLRTALNREVLEEINYDVSTKELVHFSTMMNPTNGYHLHSYKLEVTYDELKEIRTNAQHSEHFEPEMAGIVLLPIAKYRKQTGQEVGYINIMSQNFVSTAKLELEKLVKDENLLINYFDPE